jgi:hypothetical protein
MFAHYYAVAGHFEALVRENDVRALVRMLLDDFEATPTSILPTSVSKSSKKHSSFEGK